MILQTEGASIATRSMSTSVDANGDFCFKVGAGTHVIQVRENNENNRIQFLLNENFGIFTFS